MSRVYTDRWALSFSGYLALLLVLGLLGYAAYAGYGRIMPWPRYGVPPFETYAWQLGAVILAFVLTKGIYTLQPNESAVMTLFGSYAGTDSGTGLRWTVPIFSKRKVSRRLQTHHIEAIKVNDAVGNPIEIGAAIVWHVHDTAKAVLEVDNYFAFVGLQSETALRKVASSHPYDNWTDQHDGDHLDGNPTVSLRDGGDQITESLGNELRQRLSLAGLEVVDARITHLAYAPEIASAMLRRQQASAVVAARRTIVRGAVELVKEALTGLQDKDIAIDPARQAAMVSNMLVVLVSDREVTPVVSTGAELG